MTGPDDVIDVVLPVHDKCGDLQRLLDSLRSAVTRRRIVVRIVDDASREDVRSLVPPDDARCRFVYSRNGDNLGFAASVNSALAASRNDALLLNSDTLVFDDWADRLAEAARSHPRIATVTPLSNAATILSYPVPLVENPDLADASWATIDRICARGPRVPIDVPTGVGFCMLVTRACLVRLARWTRRPSARATVRSATSAAVPRRATGATSPRPTSSSGTAAVALFSVDAPHSAPRRKPVCSSAIPITRAS